MFSNEMKNNLDMINPLVMTPSLLIGGQPSEADFHYLKSVGISKVINLRPTTEAIDFDQSQLMQELAMDYHLIVIADGRDLTREAVQRLVDLLPSDECRCLFHCASGNRVGALLALKAYWFDGFDVDQAIQIGLDSGMTKLLPIVTQIIEETALLTK